jgi:hypothetical protein
MPDASDKQLAANRKDAKLGGVKSAGSKTVSRYKALKPVTVDVGLSKEGNMGSFRRKHSATHEGISANPY